jgi:hypothetical protein
MPKNFSVTLRTKIHKGSYGHKPSLPHRGLHYQASWRRCTMATETQSGWTCSWPCCLSSSDVEHKVPVSQTQACTAHNKTKHYEQQQNESHNSDECNSQHHLICRPVKQQWYLTRTGTLFTMLATQEWIPPCNTKIKEMTQSATWNMWN